MWTTPYYKCLVGCSGKLPPEAKCPVTFVLCSTIIWHKPKQIGFLWMFTHYVMHNCRYKVNVVGKFIWQMIGVFSLISSVLHSTMLAELALWEVHILYLIFRRELKILWEIHMPDWFWFWLVGQNYFPVVGVLNHKKTMDKILKPAFLKLLYNHINSFGISDPVSLLGDLLFSFLSPPFCNVCFLVLQSVHIDNMSIFLQGLYLLELVVSSC